MTVTTRAKNKADLDLAFSTLDNYKDDVVAGNVLLMISADYGTGVTDYFRVQMIFVRDGKPENIHLTWAIAKFFGYRLRDKHGEWALAISGGGFSKQDEIARCFARFYGVSSIRWERG